MTTVKMIAQRRLRMHGETIAEGEKFECSVATATELYRSARAKLADPSDLALLLAPGQPRTNGTPLRVTTR